MIGVCRARTFERLLGYVDFEAISTDGAQSFCEPKHFAVPACMCEQAGLEAIQTFALLKESIKVHEKDQVSQVIKEFSEMVFRLDGDKETSP